MGFLVVFCFKWLGSRCEVLCSLPESAQVTSFFHQLSAPVDFPKARHLLVSATPHPERMACQACSGCTSRSRDCYIGLPGGPNGGWGFSSYINWSGVIFFFFNVFPEAW